MTFSSLRSAWTTVVLGFMTAVLLASCGGGGAASTPVTGGELVLSAPSTMYGGVPVDITVTGGRPPYSLTSSEPAVLSVPLQFSSNTVTVLPANPAVVDTGLPPDSLQVRTVNLTARDSNGNVVNGSTKVGQNFLTGYGISFVSSTCTLPGSSSTTVSVCAGGDTTLIFAAAFNGNLHGGREFRLDVVQGNFTLINPATGASGTSVGVTSDHEGKATLIVHAAANSPTQIGVIRVTDVGSGVSTYQSFIINGGSSSAVLTALPSAFTFTGPDTATCGTGSGDFLVFDGVPPYNAVSSDSNVSVTYVDVNHNPGRFRVSATNPGVCITNGTVVITDANNARTTVTVNTAKGSTPATVPPTPLTVQPNSMTLACAQSSSALIIGGSGGSSGPTYSAVSTDSNLTATISGRVLTVTRAGPAGPGGALTSSNVLVTDGSQTVNVTVTSPTTCP